MGAYGAYCATVLRKATMAVVGDVQVESRLAKAILWQGVSKNRIGSETRGVKVAGYIGKRGSWKDNSRRRW